EIGDALQLLDVRVAVAAVTTLRAGGVDEPASLVDAEGLRMHAGQLGGHRDDVHRLVTAASAHVDEPPVRGLTVVAAANCSIAARCASLSDVGTSTSTVTIRSPARSPRRLELVWMPLPLTRCRDPLGVPGFRRSVTVLPSRVGTSM